MELYDAKFLINFMDEARKGGFEHAQECIQNQSVEDIAVAAVLYATNGKILLNASQIQAVTTLFGSRKMAVDMKTGEGKTYMLLAVAFLRWYTTQSNVYVLSSSGYLSERDSKVGAQLWSRFGITPVVLSPEHEGKLSNASSVYYTNVRTLMAHFTLSAFQASPSDMCTLGGSLVIDEMDTSLLDKMDVTASFPLDAFSGGSESQAKEKKLTGSLFNILWKDANKGADSIFNPNNVELDHDAKSLTFKSSFVVGAHKLWSTLSEDEGFKESASFSHFLMLAKALMEVNVFYNINVDVAKQGDLLAWLDPETGKASFGVKNDLIQQAAEFMFGVPMSNLLSSVDSMTVPSFVLAFDNISGASGTAFSDSDEYEYHYGIEVRVIEPFQSSKAMFEDIEWYRVRATYWINLANAIEKSKSHGSAVVFFNTQSAVGDAMSKVDGAIGLSPNASCEEVNEAVTQAGKFGTVLLTTYAASRGLDIVPEEGVVVSVILAERGHNKRVEVQASGRTGRYGQAGVVKQMFCTGEDSIFGSAELRMLADGYAAQYSISTNNKSRDKFGVKLDKLVLDTWKKRGQYALSSFEKDNLASTGKVEALATILSTLRSLSESPERSTTSLIDKGLLDMRIRTAVPLEQVQYIVQSFALKHWVETAKMVTDMSAFSSLGQSLGGDLWNEGTEVRRFYERMSAQFSLV